MGSRTAQVLNAVARSTVYRAPRETRRCPACESTGIVPLAVHKLPRALDGRRTGFISGCEACGLVFVNPLPTAEELAAFYSEHGDWEARQPDENPRPDPPAGVKRKGSWVRLFDAVRGELAVADPPPGARVLDFGCGRGKFLDVLQSCGWETYGIEPSTDHAFARHHRVTEIPQRPTFDLIILHHVLEHVVSPLHLLRQLAAASHPGGYMLVAVPRLDTLPVHRDYSYLINRAHITAYTWRCMETLLRQAGWEPAAPPADEVAISGGRRTAARMRVVARRIGSRAADSGERTADRGDRTADDSPLDAARSSLRVYYETAVPPRPALERRGLVRLSARVIESRRQMKKWLK